MMMERERTFSTFSLRRRRLVVISLYLTTLVIEPLLAWATIGPPGDVPLAYLLGRSWGEIIFFVSIIVVGATIGLGIAHYQSLVTLTGKITIMPLHQLHTEERKRRDRAYYFAHRINTVITVGGLLFILFSPFILDDIRRIAIVIIWGLATLLWSLPVVIVAWTQPEAAPHS